MSLKKVLFKESFDLELGGVLPEVEVAYHSFGQQHPDKKVVWVCHALTGNSDVFDWWKGLFGPKGFYDTDEYFVICANILGSHYGTTSPLSKNPRTGVPYFHDFPKITIRDMVKLHIKLANELGIQEIDMLIGGSMGGQQAMEWAIQEPKRIKNLVLLATNAVHSSWGVAFNESQRLAIENDISWQEKNKQAGAAGMKIARSIALLSYRTAVIYNESQKDPKNAVSYQHYQGEKLAKRFNAFSYWYLSHAMDSHDVGRHRGGVKKALGRIEANTLIINISSDLLFPKIDQKVLHEGIANSQLVSIDSFYGHDGFLVETDKIKNEISAFTSPIKLAV